ncbi:hypothetical protein [Candidatus Uabimicrobium amorphum]|uniref:Uncharacterized protein n=1 Tax=Uabimicrobium amorphum TaxID=2596890 RepID=A0A5S9F5T9_UABAM|nr:hypothetical protein [Candidatus Uabimicrobium amorphum]BBM86463.1 hypothetical protein UABAM_04849 [Candidatus Uabimicrobium amorphum]
MKKILKLSLVISLIFMIGCASTSEEDVDVRPLPPEDDVAYQPDPDPYPPQQDTNPVHDDVHVPTDEELNIDPNADSYEQVKYNEEVEEVARPARQSYTPEENHTPGEKTYLSIHIKNFDDRDTLMGIRQAILQGAHGNYTIEQETAPNRKSVHLKLWSDLSPINLEETLNNLFMNEGYEVEFRRKSDHLLVIVPPF